MDNLGTKLRVPAKQDLKGWTKLEEFVRAEAVRKLAEQLRTKELCRAELRMGISMMRARPRTKGTASEMEKLESELKRPIGK